MPWLRRYDADDDSYGHACLCDQHADELQEREPDWELDWFQGPTVDGEAFMCDIEGCEGLATPGTNPHDKLPA